MFYSRKKIYKLAVASGLLVSNLLCAQQMEISEHLITCSHDHNHEQTSASINTNLRSGKNLTTNEAFLAELMKIPKTAEFLFEYDSELTKNVEVRQAIEFAGEIMSREIISSFPIKVSAGAFSDSGAVANANFRGIRNFPNAPITDALYPAALANEFAGQDLNEEELRIRINADIPFYTGIDGNTDNQIDLVTALLHEMCHGLGFTFVNNGAFFNQFTDSIGNLLRDFPRNGEQIETIFASGPSLDVPGKPTLEGDRGRSRVNSLSHLSRESSSIPGNGLMDMGVGRDNVIRNIGPIVRNVFRNMGYKLTVDAIANGLFVNIPNIILNPETTENNVVNITLKNLGDTPNTFSLNEENSLIELPSKLISLDPGEIKIIKGKIIPSVLENRFTSANVQVIREGQISRNISVNITNENITTTPSISLSAVSVEKEILSNAFSLEFVNITNTSNSVIKVTSNTTSSNIQVPSEIIELQPGETKSASFTILTNDILPGNTLNDTISFTETTTSEVLQELNVITNVVGTNDVINVTANNLNFDLIATPENTNNLIERTITITNISSQSLDLEIRSLSDTNTNLINNTGVIRLAANTSQDVNLIVDAEKVNNINFDGTVEIIDALTGTLLSSSIATFNIEGIKNTRIDSILDFNDNNRLFVFDGPLIIGMEAEIILFGFNDDESNIAPIAEIIPSTDEIAEIGLFILDETFDYAASYTPTKLGPIDETLSIILKDDPDNPIIVRITGLVVESNQAISLLSLNNVDVDNTTNLNIDAGTRVLTQDEVLVDDLRLRNIGDIDLEIIEIQSSNASFRVSTDTNTVSPGGDFATLNIFFKPNTVGAITSEITIITNDPNTPSLSFTASGIGTDIIDRFDIKTPPLITLSTEGKDQTKISVNNTSLLNIEYNATPIVSYGEVSSNLLFNDISTTGINITDEFRNPFSRVNVTRDDYHLVRVNLPFETTYFGETSQTINITPYGFVNILNLSTDIRNLIGGQRIFTSQLPENDGEINSIASLGFTNDMYSAEIASLLRGNTEVFYQLNENSIVVQWNNLVYNTAGDSINGQIIVHKNGAVDVLYGDVSEGENLENLLVGVENFNGTIGVQSDLVTNPIRSASSRSYVPINDANFITNIKPNNGRINPKSTANLFVEVSAAGLPIGTYKQSILITDTASGNEEAIEVNLDVVEDQPRIATLNTTPLQFSLESTEVASETKFVEIFNTGIGVLNITDANTTTGDFTVNTQLPIEIPVGTSVYIPVTYNPIDRFAETHQAQLILTSNDAFGNTENTIDLNGNTSSPTLNTPDISNLDFKISLYPNPTKDNININLADKYENQAFQVTLINLLGQIVLTKTVQSPNIKLSVENLAPGNYILNLKDAGGSTIVNTKFIKN